MFEKMRQVQSCSWSSVCGPKSRSIASVSLFLFNSVYSNGHRLHWRFHHSRTKRSALNRPYRLYPPLYLCVNPRHSLGSSGRFDDALFPRSIPLFHCSPFSSRHHHVRQCQDIRKRNKSLSKDFSRPSNYQTAVGSKGRVAIHL